MTINIYESGGGYNHLEFTNNGDEEPNVMPVKVVVDEHEDMWFNLSKEDAKELIKYLKKEFKFSLTDIS